jgi:hypothetical protein
MADFLKRFTLHDSNWLGLHADTAWDGDVTAIISFDPIWNKTGTPATSRCPEWPVLLIRFPAVSSVTFANYKDIGGVQRGIGSAETETISDGTVVTIIGDHYGGEVTITHRDPIRVLCFASTGERLTLDAEQQGGGYSPSAARPSKPTP